MSIELPRKQPEGHKDVASSGVGPLDDPGILFDTRRHNYVDL